MIYCGIELEEFISKFFSFLKEEKAYYNFKNQLLKNEYFRNCPNYKRFFENYAKNRWVDINDPLDCIFSVELFCLWNRSEKGYFYWGVLCLKWICVAYELGLYDENKIKEHRNNIKYVINRVTVNYIHSVREILSEKYYETFINILKLINNIN